MLPEICTPLDLAGIDKSDFLVAIPGNPPSGGVHIEMGYAAAKRKPIIQIRKENGEYSPLLDGLSTRTKSICLYYKNSITDVIPGIREIIGSL